MRQAEHLKYVKQKESRDGCSKGRYSDGRPYYSLPLYLKEQFGGRLQKLSLDGGMSCPNRDGTVGYGGCIFCSEGGSGEFAADRRLSVREQIEAAKGVKSAWGAGPAGKSGYIAYFQAYTNTYGPVPYLKKLFTEALEHPEIAVLSIGTRPDCLGEEVVSLLQELQEKYQKPIWVELGLQTKSDETAARIHRGYLLECFETAVGRLKKARLAVIVHVILGLPGETGEDMVETVRYLGETGIDGIKLQLLHVLKGTELAQWYERGEVSPLSKEAYFSILGRCLQVLPREVVIHRLTGDGPKQLLIAPTWNCDKKIILNEFHHYLKEQGIVQGDGRTTFF